MFKKPKSKLRNCQLTGAGSESEKQANATDS
jgi:hypothetical protein